MPSPTPSIASDDAIDHHLDDSVNDEARGDRDIEMDDGIYQSGNQSDRNADHEARDRSDSPLSSIPDSPPPITQRSQRAPRKSYVDDTDSDLTDFSGDETSDDEIITARPRASRSNREEVKTKGKPSSKAKGKAKPKTKTKTKTRTKKRSKGKGKAQGDDSDREPEDGEAPKVKGKKQLVAKAVGWHDIPEWKEGSGCPVMSLPAEILDMTFGLRSGLRLQDYVALAGTCKFFRHHLDDRFFQEMYAVRIGNIHHLPSEAKGLPNAKRPFMREIDDWRVERPLKVDYKLPVKSQLSRKDEPEDSHYIPRGERAQWSKAQYTVYKEEQSFYRERQWKKRKTELREIAKELNDLDRKSKLWVWYNCRQRWVLGRVKAREDGQPPIERDEKGLPIPAMPEPTDNFSREDENHSSSESEVEEEQSRQESTKRKRPPSRSTRANPKNKRSKPGNDDLKKWTVPESSDEEDKDEIAYLARHGRITLHDFWPSEWRTQAAAWNNKRVLNKTAAVANYKVTDAQLLTVGHVLISNPMNSKSPMQIYSEAAVEALAFRAHGGPDAHRQYMKGRREKLNERRNEREKAKTEAIRNGTYVHKKKKRSGPFWYYYCDPDPDRCYCSECDDDWLYM